MEEQNECRLGRKMITDATKLVFEARYLLALQSEAETILLLDFWLEQWLDMREHCPNCGAYYDELLTAYESPAVGVKE